MSQFLGVGQSGMFTMDDSTTPEPHYVLDRAEHVEDMAKKEADLEYAYFGLRLEDEIYPEDSPSKPPQVRWVNWKWPRYEWETTRDSKLKVISQWMVHKNAVLHQLVLENYKQDALDVKIQPEFQPDDIHIHDANHLDSECKCEETCKCKTSSHERTFLAPGGYGRVTIHAFRKPQPPRTIAGSVAPSPGGGVAHDQPCAAQEGYSVASVIALFVDGSGEKFPDTGKELQYSVPGKSSMVPGQATDKAGTPGTLELTMAYKLFAIPGEETPWESFLFDANSINVNKILWLETEAMWGNSHQPSSSLLHLGLSQVLSGVADEMPKSGSVHRVDDGPDLNVVHVANDQRVSEATSSRSQGAAGANPALPSPEALKRQGKSIEYIAWRHLWHILSVCAVPVPCPLPTKPERGGSVAGDSPMVALTCGDLSGHRVCTSASL